MKLLVIGSGGREHAIAWCLARTRGLQKIYVAPGNAGTSAEHELENLPITDPQELADFADENKVRLTIVGPEAPLAAGIVDIFRARGLKIFGPTKAAAQLESSKEFAKRFMVKYRIPTAAFETFTDAAAAHAYVEKQGVPIVVKADGLAAGKGVVVAQTLKEAHAAIDDMLADNKLGDAGARIVIEEFLDGEEVSFIVMADGANVLPLASSQDHKRVGDGDTGPNTGGMGAYSPAPAVTPSIHAKIMREVINPAIKGMAQEGMPYVGFLYAGLMICKDGSIKTLEFNCRMGDPEAQPILMRLKTDFLKLLECAVEGKLDKAEAEWNLNAAVGVVLASAKYPGEPRTGNLIKGLPPANSFGDDAHLFHAGTAFNKAGKVVTSGGRVLCVTALGVNVRAAQKRAYELIETISFPGMQYRRDIGYRAINRKT
ncbi:MAG: phosphoribosylamine--glycine ligase [Azoarcus sp.]|jgi:phosphoribosylamine--glycine ligase|nr:phosphoribosylamine--glycine ligase [Azoarcus sp.]